MASYDIEITTDDTLELDTIIQKSSSAKKPINNVTYDGSNNYSKSILDGFETKTAVFNPPESGVYHMDINGQELSINVTDASTIPDTLIDQYERSNLNSPTAGNWVSYTGDTGAATIQSTTVLKGSSTLKLTPNSVEDTITTTRDTAYSPTEFTFLMQANADQNDGSDGNQIRIYNGSTEAFIFDLEGDNTVQAGNFGTDIGSWSDNTRYRARLYNIDYTNDQLDFELIRVSDSTVVASDTKLAFRGSVSQIDRIDIVRNTSSSSSTQPMFVDDIKTEPNS